MWTNYLKIAFRNLRRNKGYAAINVVGLAVALAACFLILLFVRDELSYDRFHEKSDRIYRLVANVDRENGSRQSLLTSPRLASTLAQRFPEVERAVRLTTPSFGGEVLVSRGDQSFYEEGFYYVDSTFFDVFDFPLLQGNPRTALAEPFTLILTRQVAEKHFGEENALGKTLTIRDKNGATREYEVTGVAENPPHNSHFHFSFLTSTQTNLQTYPGPKKRVQSWWWADYYTYVLLGEGTDSERFNEKLASFSPPTEPANPRSYKLQPLEEIHLYSHYERELEPNSDARYLYVFSAIALLILIVAGVNYMNLATARSAHRAQEVGVRKAVGAHRLQLTGQFLSEALLFGLASFLLALVFTKLALPFFNDVTGKPLDIDYFRDGEVLLSCAGISVIAGLLAGSYPAFVLSGFKPVQVLSGVFRGDSGNVFLRKGLVVFQFGVSIALIVGTMVTWQQLSHMQSERLGLDEEHVVIVPTRDALTEGYPAFKNTLLQHSGIVSVTAAALPFPITEALPTTIRPEGIEEEEASGINIGTIMVDPDFAETMDIPLVSGRDLTTVQAGEGNIPVLVNEEAVKQFGWEEPVGKEFTGFSQTTPRVVGVVRDFHYRSLKDPIEPLVMMEQPMVSRSPGYVFIRVQPENLAATLDYLRKTWSQVSDVPVEYTFLDRRFDQVYQSEERLARIFSAFAFLVILIACLGLFGLAAYMAERRTKEIGIRKVFGASIGNIVSLLSKDFAWLVVVAFVIAAPVAYYAMSRWLHDFAYRIELGPWVLVGADLLALVIAMVTVSYQAIRAALANPADTLRYE